MTYNVFGGMLNIAQLAQLVFLYIYLSVFVHLNKLLLLIDFSETQTCWPWPIRMWVIFG